MVAHSVGVSHGLPRQLRVYNPVGNALAFHSNKDTKVPKGWNKKLRYTKTIQTPGGPFHFFILPGIEVPTY